MDLAHLEFRVAPVLDHHRLVICVAEDVAILDGSLCTLVDEYAAHLAAINCTLSDNGIRAFADLHVGVSVVEDLTSRDHGITVLRNFYSYALVVEDLAIFHYARTVTMNVNSIAFTVVNAGSAHDGLAAVPTLEPVISVAPDLAVLKSSQTTIRHHDARVPAVVHFAAPQGGIAVVLDPHARHTSTRDVAVFQSSLSPG